MAKRCKKGALVAEGEVAPRIWDGLTQGIPKDEALALHPVRPNKGGVELVKHMREGGTVNRVPLPRFVASDHPGAHMIDESTGRVLQDAVITFTGEVLAAIKSGHICLRCHEPQAIPFPEECDLCGYAMRRRQVMDIAVEFEGEKHLGPARPVSEFLEEQNLRMEKRRFIERVLAGGQGRIPKEWLLDKSLFPDGPPPQLL